MYFVQRNIISSYLLSYILYLLSYSVHVHNLLHTRLMLQPLVILYHFDVEIKGQCTYCLCMLKFLCCG